MNLTRQQELILLHALGSSHTGTENRSKLGWRNHYAAGPGHSSYEDCIHLVSIGAMTHSGDVFYVTDAGAARLDVRIKP